MNTDNRALFDFVPRAVVGKPGVYSNLLSGLLLLWGATASGPNHKISMQIRHLALCR